MALGASRRVARPDHRRAAPRTGARRQPPDADSGRRDGRTASPCARPIRSSRTPSFRPPTRSRSTGTRTRVCAACAARRSYRRSSRVAGSSSCSTARPCRAASARSSSYASASTRIGRRPVVQVPHAAHAGLVGLLEAAEARAQRRVEGRALDGVAELGRLEDRVLLGVDADADVVAAPRQVVRRVGAPVTAALVAVGEAGGRAVVAGRDDPLVGDEHGADVAAQARGSLTSRHGQEHEVLLGGGAHRGAAGVGSIRGRRRRRVHACSVPGHGRRRPPAAGAMRCA